eukprot:236044-Hanusia_phi.AAC.3
MSPEKVNELLSRLAGDLTCSRTWQELEVRQPPGAEEKVSVLERIKKANQVTSSPRMSFLTQTQMYSQGEFVGALETYKDILQQVCLA